MGQAIRACEEGDYLLVTVSHVNDDGVGIVGRSGKLHIPDCDSAGQSIAVQITANEEGYVVGTPDSPTPDTNAPLFVQRGVNSSDPESDQLDEVTYAEWRRRRFAYRLHGILPNLVATRIPPQSFTLSTVWAGVRIAATIAVVGGLFIVSYAALTAGIDAASGVISFAIQRPDVAFVFAALTVLGLANAYFGFILYELYIKIAGMLAGAAAGLAVGTVVAPAFGGAMASSIGSPGMIGLQNAIIFGIIPIVGGLSIGASLGWNLAVPLHNLAILLGGFIAVAQPLLVVFGGVSLLTNPTGIIDKAPFILVIAVVGGIGGAIVAWKLYVVMVVILTSALGAGLLTVAFGLAPSFLSGTIPGSLSAIPYSLQLLAIPFLFFFLSGIGSQFGLSRLLPEDRDDETVDPLNTPDTREGWEPP